jgi:CheY-like chemotaxis protein
MIILLVDDDEDDRKLFCDAAKELDTTITCIPARDGQEALTYLRNLANPLPDFIFLDLRMPGLSGQQCLVEIKSEPRLMSIPVMIYTTSRNVRESEELKQLGATHFMSKPVSPDDVYYMLSFVLGETW